MRFFSIEALTAYDPAWVILGLLSFSVLLWLISWLLSPASKPASLTPSLSSLSGLDAATAAKLRRFGITTDRELVKLTPRGQQELESELGLHNGEYDHWRRQILSHWRAQYLPEAFRSMDSIQASPELGGVYTKRPHEIDDLTKLPGVDKVIATRLHHAGIYTFEQLRVMTPEQRACFKERFNLAGFSFEDVPAYGVTAQWLAVLKETPAPPTKNDPAHAASSPAGDAAPPSSAPLQPSAGTVANASSEIPRSQDDPDLGRVYTSAPPHRDNLTLLPDVTPEVAQQLHAAGLFTVDQLRSMSPQQRDNFRRRFDLPDFDFAGLNRRPFSHQRVPQPHVAASAVAATPATVAQVLPRRDDDASPSAATSNVRKTSLPTSSSPTTTAAPTTQQPTPNATCRSEVCGWLHSIRLPQVAPGVFDGKALVAYPEQVIYRGEVPRFWGQSIQRPQDGITGSLAANEIRADINYVRIRRLDTRESVVAPVLPQDLFSPGADQDRGWNGQCDEYFGAHHLGVYAAGLPNQVETKMGYGGWGFGHVVDQHDTQGYCWAGQPLPPTAFEISVGKVTTCQGTVVFRSRDPRIWNQSVSASEDHWSVPVDSVSERIAYVRIARTDTNEGVIVAVDRVGLTSHSEGRSSGWNGQNEPFFGGHHLGVFCAEAPHEAEVTYGKGGWGFGHLYGQDDRQAYAWAGKAIPPTTFEIRTFASVPPSLKNEILDG